MKQREFEMLGRAFAAEIEGRLPLQTKSKVAVKLMEDGMLQPWEETFQDRFGKMEIKGFALTHKGRHAYCSLC